MNVVFMGTPEFAVPTLEALVKEHNVSAVVTQPDKPKGRGKKMMFSAVKEKALEYGLTVYQPEKVKDSDFVQVLKELAPDIMVVVAFGQILSEEILNIPKYGCINVHGSLLPEYRGAAPIQWSIIHGREYGGVTTMYMAKGLDSGDMILKAQEKIRDDDTYGSLYDRLSVIGADLLIKTLELIESGEAQRTPQNDAVDGAEGNPEILIKNTLRAGGRAPSARLRGKSPRYENRPTSKKERSQWRK